MTAAPSEILAELALGHNLCERHLDRFRAEGVPLIGLLQNALRRWSPVRRDRVTFLGNRFEFERHRGSEEVVGSYTVGLFDQFGEAFDIAAWRPPSGLATWLGVSSMLGEELILAPRFGPLRVHGTALEWFRAGRDGVVVVDPTRAAALLRNAAPLAVATVAEGRALRQILAVPLPEILIADESASPARAA